MKEINKRFTLKIIEITINVLFWIFIIFTILTNYDLNYFQDTINYISSYNLNPPLFVITLIAKIILDFIQKLPLDFIMLSMYVFYIIYRKKYERKKTYIINEYNIEGRKILVKEGDFLDTENINYNSLWLQWCIGQK